MKADRLTPDVLQAMVQHKIYRTTQRYIALAKQMTPAAANLLVPDLSGKKSTVSLPPPLSGQPAPG